MIEMGHPSTKKIRRSTEDIYIVESDEEEKYRQDNYEEITKHVQNSIDVGVMCCTVCNDIISILQALPHPALRVLICVSCNSKYEKRFSEQNETNENCRWCSEPVIKYSCSYCTCIFCEVSVFINFILILKCCKLFLCPHTCF